MPIIVLISGANQGIGLAVAERLAKEHDYHVIIGSRSAEAGQEVAKQLVDSGHQASSVQLDLNSQDSIDIATDIIKQKFGYLDVLINNAGIGLDLEKGRTTRELYTETFNTNVIGTACLTEAVLPLLRKSTLPRIVFVSSTMGSLAQATVKDTPFYAIDYKAYDASKAAVNMLALNYARILEDVNGKSNAVCPGLVSTKFTSYTQYGTSTFEGAEAIIKMATVGKDGPTATFWRKDGNVAW